MLCIFGHHISRYALTLAVLEAFAFVTIYAVIQAVVFQIVGLSTQDPGAHGYLLPACTLIAFLTAAACGLYNGNANLLRFEFRRRILGVSAAMYSFMAFMICVAVSIFPDNKRLYFYYLIALLSVAGYTAIALLARQRLFGVKLNASSRRILVLGTDEHAAKVEYLNGISRSSYVAVGFLPIGNEAISESLSSFKVLKRKILDRPEGLAIKAQALRVDEIVVASRNRAQLPLDALLECKLRGIPITELADFWERQIGQIDLDDVSPTWLVFSEGFRSSTAALFVKRAFDIAVAVALLIMTLPMTICAAIAIKLDSTGPIFYTQERVGMDGVVFKIFKFRSMTTDAESDGVARWAKTNDSRVTRIGHFLRRTRIDEIPQIRNVLNGTMSLVGPRPERPVFVDRLKLIIPRYDIRHCIKPGITGWAQINYPYGASDEDARVKLAYDLYYVKNRSLLLDTIILAQTVSVVLWPVAPSLHAAPSPFLRLV